LRFLQNDWAPSRHSDGHYTTRLLFPEWLDGPIALGYIKSECQVWIKCYRPPEAHTSVDSYRQPPEW
jgi:hypothetical protein